MKRKTNAWHFTLTMASFWASQWQTYFPAFSTVVRGISHGQTNGVFFMIDWRVLSKTNKATATLSICFMSLDACVGDLSMMLMQRFVLNSSCSWWMCWRAPFWNLNIRGSSSSAGNGCAVKICPKQESKVVSKFRFDNLFAASWAVAVDGGKHLGAQNVTWSRRPDDWLSRICAKKSVGFIWMPPNIAKGVASGMIRLCWVAKSSFIPSPLKSGHNVEIKHRADSSDFNKLLKISAISVLRRRHLRMLISQRGKLFPIECVFFVVGSTL